jgi:MerR family redox-sensitive transcriptional activator SoxR
MSTAPNRAALPIGDVARLAGVTVATLRFYEDQGLLRSDRDPQGRRTYARQTLRRLAFIAAGRRLGLSLATIRAALAPLPADRAPTARQWGAIGVDWLQRIDDEIAALNDLRGRLVDCVSCGCLTDDCELVRTRIRAAP